MKAPLVRVHDLSVAVDSRRLIGPIDLELQEGERVLLVGPSGSGKTTLLRALAGLVAPSAGTIELFGQVASSPGRLDLAPEKRNTALLFQGAALWPHMSCAKTLAFVLARRGIQGAAARTEIARLLGEVELSGFEERMPATLSGGERQRLALARAMAAAPRLLLLDEPLGPLDEELRKGLLERLETLQREYGWTTLHVTHNPREAERFADRTIRMAEGRIELAIPSHE